MKAAFIALISLAIIPAVHAQNLRDLFRKVSPSVVVIRTVEKAAAPTTSEGFVRLSGLGSGVLLDDRKVMTAAHVVELADRIEVEFANGEAIGARVISSEARADVALLLLDRVPAGAIPARLADSIC